jgi:hypothetical protein
MIQELNLENSNLKDKIQYLEKRITTLISQQITQRLVDKQLILEA